jgi:hypothetical protein
MPLRRCASCGADTFFLEGWVAAHSCAGCGRALAFGVPGRFEESVRLGLRRFRDPARPANGPGARSRALLEER